MMLKTTCAIIAAEKTCLRSFARAISSLTNSAIQVKRNQIFDKEKERQRGLLARVEKIEVQYIGLPEKCTLLMNKLMSTPHNCAMHIHEVLTERSALAEVNGVPWDMHRPLEKDCTLKFLHFKEENPHHANKAFWRSCSFLLGKIIESVFKDEFYVELHSWPKPDIKSGSFVYDCDLKIKNWNPRDDELRTITTAFWDVVSRKLNFERLEVDASVALQMFEDNRFKSAQIPDIASKSSSGNTVTLYRVGKFIDISTGPMIANTKQIGRSEITAVHQIETRDGMLYRFQGVALPAQLPLNIFAFRILTTHAKQLNTLGLPTQQHRHKEIKSEAPKTESAAQEQEPREKIAAVNCVPTSVV